MTCKRVIPAIFAWILMGTFLVTSVIASVPYYSLLWSKGSYGAGDGQYNNPRGIAIDDAGNIFVADTGNHRFQKLDSNGNYVSKFGTIGSTKSIGDLAVDSSGNIYGALTGQHQIKKFSAAYSTLWTKGTTTAGSGEGYYSSPQGIATNGTNVYIADTNNHRVQVILASNGTFVRAFGSSGTGDGQLRYPYDVDVDASGNIYVADRDNHRIQKFDSSGVFQSKFGVYGAGLGQFNQPTGIDIDSAGNIYVADYLNKRVQKFNSDGVFLAVFGGFTGNNYRVGVNSSNHVVTVDLSEQIYKFDFNGTAYQIGSLDSSLNAIDLSNNLNIESTQLYGTTSGTVRLKNNSGYAISDVVVTLSADSNWSAVTGETDRTSGKSVVHNLTSAAGTAPTHSLYVPIPIGKNSTSVRICPDATNLSEVSGSCANGVSRSPGTYTESFGEITVSYVNNLGDNAAYWKIAGMTGSGGEAEGGSWTGSGTEGDPYQITTCVQLQEMNENLSAYYRITTDIDCTGTTTWNGGNGFAPVGSASATPFTGSLTGTADFQIDGIYESISHDGFGLFGYTTGATLSQVHLTNLHYTKGSVTYYDLGGLIGYMNGGSISNSSTGGQIEQTTNFYKASYNIGGIVGRMVSDASILSCNSSVNIDMLEQPYQVGGIVGWMEGTSSISNTYATGHVFSGHSANNSGGFVGYMKDDSSISDSYATGAVHFGRTSNTPQGDSYYIGGFAGTIGSTTGASITDSYATGAVTGTILNGGSSATITDFGGFAGYVGNNSSLLRTHSTGTVTVDNTINVSADLPYFYQVGGYAGTINGTGSQVTDSYSTSPLIIDPVYSGTNVGGFAGKIIRGTISNGYATGNITFAPDDGTGDMYTGRVGGFVGNLASYGIITQSYSTGNISTSGIANTVGGFVGMMSQSGGTGVSISESFSTGNVNGKDLIGGFIGYLQFSSSNSSISNSYSRGNVYSRNELNYDESIGGFAGEADSGTFLNTYSTGTVTSDFPSTALGGFIGDSFGSTVTSSYWDTELSGVSTSPAGTGRTTAEMKDTVNYATNFVSWDFGTIWEFVSGVNNDYPVLQWANFTPVTPTPTPTTAPSNDAGSTTTGTVLGSTTEAPDTGCGKPAPPSAPYLFEANRKGKKVTLSYTPVNDNTTGYTIMYGFFAGDNRFSVSFDQGPSSGALQYTVDGLENNQEYAFWIRAYNECVPGPWSNYLLVNKTGSTTELPQPTPTPTPTPEPVTSITPSITPTEEVSSISEPITVDLTVTDQVGIPIENTEVIISEKPPKTKGPKKPPVASAEGELVSSSAGVEGEIFLIGVTDEYGMIEIEIDPGKYIMTAEVLGKTFSSEIEIDVGEKEQREVLNLDFETLIEKDVAPLAIASTKAGVVGAGIVVVGSTAMTGVSVTQTLSPIYTETGRSVSLLPLDTVRSLTMWIASLSSGLVSSLTGFALKKKRYAGVVFDSLGISPLSGAFVVFYTQAGALSTDFTDYFGQYTVKPEPGVYDIKVDRENYNFPSKLVTSKTYDRYINVYIAGEKIEVNGQGDEQLEMSIPLDPSKKSRNKEIMTKWIKILKLPVAVLAVLMSGIALYYKPNAFHGTVFVIIGGAFLLSTISFTLRLLTEKSKTE